MSLLILIVNKQVNEFCYLRAFVCLSALCLGPQHTAALTVKHGAKCMHLTTIQFTVDSFIFSR